MVSGVKRKLQGGEMHPIGSVLLAARSNHVDVTMQVTDTSQEGQHPDRPSGP